MKPTLRALVILLLLPVLAAAQTSVGERAPTLQASIDGRYLQWSDGTPFFILADTAWTLPSAYTNGEVIDYLDHRRGDAFNAIQLCALFGDATNESAYGKAFSNADLSQPIEAYWKHVDWVVTEATRRGLVVIIDPVWKSHFTALLKSNGPEKTRAFGRWFAQRYRDNPRVLYFVGGDQEPEPVRAELAALGQGIQDVYQGAAIVAFHSQADQSSREAFPESAWLTLNWTHAYAPPYHPKFPYEVNWANRGLSPAQPIQFAGGFYDFGADTKAGINHQRGKWADRFALRRQLWWAGPLTGAAGDTFGAEAIGMHQHGSQTWSMAFASKSARDVRVFKHFIEGVAWWTLNPDVEHTFLSAGFGEWRTDHFAVAAVSQDRTLAIVYTPVVHALELRLDRLRDGEIYAQWFDPSSGEYQAAELRRTEKDRVVTITSPAQNAAGESDFVLVVRSFHTGADVWMP